MKTAIDWLIEQVNSENYQRAFGQTYISVELIEQAKQMEKEQIMNAHDAGACNYQGGEHNFHFFQENDHYYHEVYFVKP